MAIFSRTKKNTRTRKSEKVASASAPAAREVLVRPHLTEKAVALSERHVYTFQVHPDANKYEIALAVQRQFQVTPVKVRIVRRRSRRVQDPRRGQWQTEPQSKKAYVTLKQGETIQLI